MGVAALTGCVTTPLTCPTVREGHYNPNRARADLVGHLHSTKDGGNLLQLNNSTHEQRDTMYDMQLPPLRKLAANAAAAAGLADRAACSVSFQAPHLLGQQCVDRWEGDALGGTQHSAGGQQGPGAQ